MGPYCNRHGRKVAFGRAACAVLAVSLCTFGATSLIAQPRIRVSQAVAQGNEVKAFLDLRDSPSVSTLTNTAFSGTLGGAALSLRSIQPFDKSEEGLFLVVLVDVSRSVSPQAFDSLKQVLLGMVDDLRPADRVAVYTFGETVVPLQDATGDKAVLRGAVQKLQRRAGRTLLYQAVDRALQLAKVEGTTLPHRRAIVILSDGQDDGSGLTIDDVAKRLEQTRTPILTTDYELTNRPGIDTLTKLAVLSGGLLQHSTAIDISKLHMKLRAAVRNVYIAKFACRCPQDGQQYSLTIRYSVADYRVSDSLTVPSLPALHPNRAISATWWAVGGSGSVVVCALVALVWRRHRRRELPEPLIGNAPELAAAGPDRATPIREGHRESRSGVMPLRLTVVRGARRGEDFHAMLRHGSVIVVGSEPGSDVHLAGDPDIAARHCAVQFNDDVLTLVEVEAGLRTTKNGVSIRSRARLEDGDIIGVGSTELRVRRAAGI